MVDTPLLTMLKHLKILIPDPDVNPRGLRDVKRVWPGGLLHTQWPTQDHLAGELSNQPFCLFAFSQIMITFSYSWPPMVQSAMRKLKLKMIMLVVDDKTDEKLC